MKEKYNTNAKAKFIKVVCKNCGAENVMFSRATVSVRCPDCNKIQSVPKGGKCKLVNCSLKEELE